MIRRCRAVCALLIGFLAPSWLTAATAAFECTPLERSRSTPTVPDHHARGLLWRIEKPGQPPSHLFGTLHLGDPEIVNLPTEVARAFESSRRLVVETRLDDPEEQRGLARAMTYAEETRLPTLIGPALFSGAARLLQRHGIPPRVAASLKPWAAFVTLSMPPPDGRLALDLSLMQRARAAGKPVVGLETLQEQVDIFARLPLQDQVSLLTDVICHYDTLQAEVALLRKAYLDRDLAHLMARATRYQDREPLARRVWDAFLWNRNERMAKRLRSHLHPGNAFIAVGSLHLPGPRGLLGLLEAQGYRLTPVY